jgi:hypothetical protein
MRRSLLGLICLIWVVSHFSACTGAPPQIEVELGQGFLLPIGREVAVTGENLRIRFEGVIEDSRCPLDVTCVWEGRASVQLEITYDNNTHSVVLNEPGLTDYSVDEFRAYSISFHLKPYPGDVEDISGGDYYLQLTVSKQEDFSPGTDEQAEIYY